MYGSDARLVARRGTAAGRGKGQATQGQRRWPLARQFLSWCSYLFANRDRLGSRERPDAAGSLQVEDALAYLEHVKTTFQSAPQAAPAPVAACVCVGIAAGC